jgi:hypothetical protein
MMHRVPRRQPRRSVAVAILAFAAMAAGCASSPAPVPDARLAPQAPERLTWQLKTREHVDLWLHGYAVLTEDSSQVPLFRPDWRDYTTVLKNQRGVVSALDTARATLRRGLARNPGLAGGQFAPLYFATWADFRQAIAATLSSDGNPRRAGSLAPQVALLAAMYPSPADREWLRLFSQAVQDEYDRWFHLWWVEAQRARVPVLDAATARWGRVRDALAGYLRGTQQAGGEALLSLVLAGEGRTVQQGRSSAAAVTFPERVEDADQVVFVLVHEQAGALAGSVVADHTTPAEKRAGLADRLNAVAAVRAGALILDRVGTPALAAGYRRYYLAQARAAATADFDTTFALPGEIAAALARQIELVMGGI